MDRALMVSTGSNYADFEHEVHVYLVGRFNLIGLVSDTMYLWLGLAVVVIVGFILSLRRRKKYYERWAEDERLASTDFDYGDPDRPEEIDDDEPWRR
jgi:LPXTG-motif cell wall-anchored protein